jgi:Carboxylesterase family
LLVSYTLGTSADGPIALLRVNGWRLTYDYLLRRFQWILRRRVVMALITTILLFLSYKALTLPITGRYIPSSSGPSEIMRLADFMAALFGSSSAAAASAPTDHLVELDYAQYNGLANGDGVSAWLGMRFAAPPLGDLRFRAPADPVHETDVVDAKAHRPVCYSAGESWSANKRKSDDCLFINVFAPTDAKEGDNLPVFFFIQGGGYNANSNCEGIIHVRI